MADSVWDMFGDSADDPAKKAPQESNVKHYANLAGEAVSHIIPDNLGFIGDLAADAGRILFKGGQGLELPGTGVVAQKIAKLAEPITAKPEPLRNTGERIASSAIRMGADALAAAPFGAEEGAMSVWKLMAGGGAGGAAAQGTHEAFPKAPNWVPYVMGMVVGGATGAALHGGSPVARGMSDPDTSKFINTVIPALEGGGTLEHPAINPKSGARGPMQVTPETAAKPGYKIAPWNGQDETDLVRVGQQKYAALVDRFDGDHEKALAAYNWGEGNVLKAVKTHGDEWLQHAPEETRNYVTKGMEIAYGSKAPSAVSAEQDTTPPEDQGQPEGFAPLAPDSHETVPISGDDPSDNVIDMTGKRGAQIDNLNDHLINTNLRFAEQIHDGIDQGVVTAEHLPNIMDARDKAEMIRDKFGDYLSKEQLSKVEDNLDMLNSAIDRLSPPKSSAPDTTTSARPPEPANDTSEQDAADREGMFGFKGGQGQEPPKEPPFGGGGEPPSEPPSNDGDKYAGSINLSRMLIGEEAKQSIRNMAKPMNLDIETHNETRAKAEQLINDKGVEGVLNIDTVAPKDLAHYTTAVRAIHAAAQDHMVRMNDEFLDPSRNSDVAHVRWLHARDVLATAFDRHEAVSKGMGRGLGAMRIEVGGHQGFDGEGLGDKVAEAMKSKKTDEEIARLIQEHPDQADKIAKDSQRPGASEYIFTTWYAMLLSSLKTLARNVLSNAIMNAVDTFLVHPMAATIGTLHGGEKVTFREVGARMGGVIQGAVEGVKNAPEAYRRGTPSDFVERTQSYWKPKNKGLGRILGAPGRVLAAQDQVFLDAAQNANYFGMAHRIAAREGLTGQDYRDSVMQLLENPTKEMHDSSVKYGQMMRFQDPMEFKGLEYATRATKSDPLAIKIMKGFARVLFPFPRNSDRMFFGAMRNSPLGIIEPQNLRDFAAGGARRDVAMARVLVGTAATTALYLWAANGGITGAGPSDPAKFAEWRQNHQPYSLNFGHVHVSYQGVMDPFGIIIAGVATGVEQAREKSDSLVQKITKASTNMIGVMMDDTWSLGASQFFQALDDKTGKTMENWIGRMASSFSTPAIVREINQDYLDPTVRDTRGNPVTDQVKAGLPVASKTLPARVDLYGNPIVRDNPGKANVINPSKVQRDKGPEVSQDIDQIPSDNAIVTRAPNKIDGKKLTPEEQDKFQQASGKYVSEMLSSDPSWRFLPQDQKAKRIKEIVGNARDRAKADMRTGGAGIWSTF